MSDFEITRSTGFERWRGVRLWRDEIALKMVGAILRHVASGRVRLTLPSGRTAVFGSGGVEASLSLGNSALLWNALMRGSIGVAESYIDGDFETDDLGDLFRFFLDNKRALDRAGGGHFRVRSADKRFHRLRRNTRRGSRHNIAAHYDLGNPFYELWLDRSLAYSSAMFNDPGQSLEAAQAEKNRCVVDALALEPEHRLLEIGCGWGSFAETAAQAGAAVTAITISREQWDYARGRLAAAGLGDRAEVRFEDYRDTAGAFDRIVSIEMIEAVGEENWPRFFRTLHERLVPGGVALLQAITIAPEHYARYRRKADFIQRYIFPGGMLPTVDLMASHAREARLEFEVVARFGASYARTLALWRERFEAQWPRIAALGFDERFRRLWTYYLTYCEIGFERGVIDVGHYRMRRLTA